MEKQTIKDSIIQRIKSFDSNEAFTASDFADIADINTIWQVLTRLEQSKEIQRIFRGVYYCPIYSELINEFEAPSPDHVAKAIARKHGWTIAPSGNTALNQLGLSTQVSSKWSYISDGPYNTYQFNNIEIEFKHCSNKDISGLSHITTLVIQALKALGKNGVTEEVIQKLKNMISANDKIKILTEGKQSTAWIYRYIKIICK